MKILFVISSLGTGGSERVLVTLANYLVKKYEITIVLLSTDTIFYDIDSNVKVISLNLSKSAKSFIDGLSNNFNRIKVLSKTIKKENPDIIISFLTRTNILSIVASKLVGKKIIVSERSNYNFLKSKVWRFLRRAVYPFADGLVVQSKYDKLKYNFHKNCQIIYNPLFTKNFKKIDFFKKEHIILGVGRIDYNKGFDRLVKAYFFLDTDWKLIIVGEGEERENLQNMIKKLNLENKVFLVGKKKNIEEYYKKASIFVLSSRMEGFPNVLIEAMSFGCACIAFDCLTGPREIINNGINGILVENGNIKKLSSSIKELISNEEKRKYLGKNAVNVRYKLNIDKISQQWEDMIYTVLNKGF